MAVWRPRYKLNDRVRKRICDAIRDGNYAQTAVKLAGIHPQTHYDWMRRGREECARCQEEFDEPTEQEEDYVKYYLAVEQAKAECEDAAVQSWESQIPHDWKAARDFLARRFPERWGNREVVEVHQPDITAILNNALERIYGKDTDE